MPGVREVQKFTIDKSGEELYKNIDTRIDNMFKEGFIEEVQKILAKGYKRDLPSLSAIGYKEVIELIHNEITKEEAVTLIKRRTRQYVRRQANWFKKNDPRIKWFNVKNNIQEDVKAYILSPNGWNYE